jgi:hypothetical protein
MDRPKYAVYANVNGKKSLWCRAYYWKSIEDVMDLLKSWGMNPSVEVINHG